MRFSNAFLRRPSAAGRGAGGAEVSRSRHRGAPGSSRAPLCAQPDAASPHPREDSLQGAGRSSRALLKPPFTENVLPELPLARLGAGQNSKAHGYTSHSLTQRRKPQNLDSREETAADRVADEIDS